MLVVYHNIYDAWIYPGGHVDGENNLLSVAIREVEEETGLKTKILDNSIFAISALPVKGHIKRGKYVPAHTHLDVVYLLEADENDILTFKEDENKGVKWIAFEDATKNDIVDLFLVNTEKCNTFKSVNEFKEKAQIDNKLLKDIWNDTTNRDWLQ